MKHTRNTTGEGISPNVESPAEVAGTGDSPASSKDLCRHPWNRLSVRHLSGRECGTEPRLATRSNIGRRLMRFAQMSSHRRGGPARAGGRPGPARSGRTGQRCRRRQADDRAGLRDRHHRLDGRPDRRRQAESLEHRQRGHEVALEARGPDGPGRLSRSRGRLCHAGHSRHSGPRQRLQHAHGLQGRRRRRYARRTSARRWPTASTRSDGRLAPPTSPRSSSWSGTRRPTTTTATSPTRSPRRRKP